MERLTLRVGPGVERALGADVHELWAVMEPSDVPSRLRGLLSRPAQADVLLMLRVHSASGVPLARAEAKVRPGDTSFDTTGLAFFAMEGYAHLQTAQVREIESRVWTRRAYATAQMSGHQTVSPAVAPSVRSRGNRP